MEDYVHISTVSSDPLLRPTTYTNSPCPLTSN